MSASARASQDSLPVLTGPGLADVIAERIKQVDQHGYTLQRDQQMAELLDLPQAAISYANTATDQLAGIRPNPIRDPEPTYPWSEASWRPEPTARGNLVKAAALLLAAIDYLDQRDRVAGNLQDAA